jgi:hypothetical protein
MNQFNWEQLRSRRRRRRRKMMMMMMTDISLFTLKPFT